MSIAQYQDLLQRINALHATVVELRAAVIELQQQALAVRPPPARYVRKDDSRKAIL